METTVEVMGPCKRKLHCHVPAEQVKKAVDKAYNDLKNTVTIPGFRRGKAPRSLLEKRFGKEVHDDVKRELVLQGLEDGLKNNEIHAVGEPDIDFSGIVFAVDSDMSFDVMVEVKPEFDLPLYTGIEVTRKVAPVTEADIDGVVKSMLSRLASWVPVEDRPTKLGDLVLGSLKLEGDGEVLWQTEESHFILEEKGEMVQGLPFPNACQAFEGKILQSEVNWTVVVPEWFEQKDLDGREVSATFTINEIKRAEIPELTDEVVKPFGVDSAEKFRSDIKERIVHRREHQADHDVQEAIITRIVDQTNFEVPDQVIKRTVRIRATEKAREVAYRMIQDGMEVTKESISGLIDQYSVGLEDEAVRAIRTWYIIEKIGKKEKIFCTEDDFMNRVEQLARSRNKKTAEILKEIEQEEAEGEIRADILEHKVMDFLTQKARIVDESGAPYTGVIAPSHDHDHDHDHDHEHMDDDGHIGTHEGGDA